jgi:hypothetical protein
MRQRRGNLRLAGIVAILFVGCFITITGSVLFGRPIPPRPPGRLGGSTAKPNIMPSGSIPLSFERNEGQTSSDVRFVAHGRGYTLFLTQTGAYIALEQLVDDDPFVRKLNAKTRKRFEAGKLYRSSPRFHRNRKTRVVNIVLDNANPNARIEPIDELPGKSNYFIGDDPRMWRSGIPTYARVRYAAIYPGVDLIHYGNQNRLEFDFVVSPGADPNEIALRFGSHEDISLRRDGALQLGSLENAVLLGRPSIYQLDRGRKRSVRGGYVLRTDGRVGIRVGEYDRGEPLIVDPVLAYSTYLGGNGGDDAAGIAVDSSGNAYVVGFTGSTNFPVVNGYQSEGSGTAFVSKLDPSGTTVLYSTYLGGTGGDYGSGIAIDSSGSAYVTGYTFSTDFPVVNGFQATNNNSANGNGFVARIDTTQTGVASLAYSTYLGGGGNTISQTRMGDFGIAIATNGSGIAYVTGSTTSDTSVVPFPTTATAYQSSLGSPNGNAFLVALNTNQSGPASLAYSTYLGGDGTGPFGDFGADVVVDSLGDAYLVGETSSDASAPFPTSLGAYQSSLKSSNGNAFVAEIATTFTGSQSLVYSTYLGGSTENPLGDYGGGIAIDSAGKVYLAGDAESNDFPVTAGAYQSANSAEGKTFVAKLDLSKPGIQSLVYSTFLGGTVSSAGDIVGGIAVDTVGDAFVTGATSSSDFPTTSGAVQSTLSNSSWNAFLSQVNPQGTGLLYSTFLGGSCSEQAASVALDPLVNAYVAGYTCSSDFPTYPSNAFQTVLGGSQTGFIAKISVPTPVVSITVNPASPNLTLGATQEFTATATLSDGSTPDVTAGATWTSSDTSVITLSNLFRGQGFSQALGVGTAYVTAAIGGVSGSAAITVVLPPAPPTITSVMPPSGAAGTAVTINGSGFGATRGSGYIYLGTAFGIVSSWSDSQILATVAASSTSGVVQVGQSGLQSNSVNFSVSTPTITSVSWSGIAGTPVTIAGTGFGATQGSGQVWLGSANGVVSSWSDTQIVATVAAGATSGNAQVLQNGVWSNAIAFAVNAPHITGISQPSGPVGTVVTISGSGFGAGQGSGQVWLGSTNGIVDSWSDTQVTATVANSAVTGIVRIQQSGIWSNALSFSVTGSGSQLTLVPNTITMMVDETRTVQAVNAQGQSVTGLTWTSSDVTVVSLSADDPPILTAVAAGHATITAGNASADVTVTAGTSLSPGTVQWSNPGDGSGVVSIVPAVPSGSGVDVFAFQGSGSVAAIRTDGTTAWTANVSSGYATIPDFKGGLVYVTGQAVQELDPVTGLPHPPFACANSCYSALVHTDGTIMAVDGSSIVGIDPVTGGVKFKVTPSEQNISSDNGNCGEYTPFVNSGPVSLSGQSLIAGDGYAYFSYGYGVSQNMKVCYYNGSETAVRTSEFHSRLLRVGTDGSALEVSLGDWKEDAVTTCIPVENVSNGECPGNILSYSGGSIPSGGGSISMLTNADQGVMISQTLCMDDGSPCTYRLIPITNGAIGASVGTQVGLTPVLQRPDGTYVGFAANNMAAFDQSGNVRWSVPNYSPVVATADGGAIARSFDGTTTSTFDANGNATGQIGNLPTYSWKGAYTLGSVDSVIPTFDLANIANSFSATVGGNLTGNGFSLVQHTFGLAFCNTGTGGDGACPSNINPTNMAFSYLANINNDNYSTACDFSQSQPCDSNMAHPEWVDIIKIQALNTYIAAFANLPAIVSRHQAITNLYGGSSNPTSFEHTIFIDGSWKTATSLCPSTGLTDTTSYSWAFYLSIMCGAQIELSSRPPFSDTANFKKLVTAIGKGIGNVATHETGHQLAFIGPYKYPLLELDCGTEAKPCEGGVNSVYEFYQDDEWNYVDWTPPIHWEPGDKCNLQRYLLNTNLPSNQCN